MKELVSNTLLGAATATALFVSGCTAEAPPDRNTQVTHALENAYDHCTITAVTNLHQNTKDERDFGHPQGILDITVDAPRSAADPNVQVFYTDPTDELADHLGTRGEIHWNEQADTSNPSHMRAYPNLHTMQYPALKGHEDLNIFVVAHTAETDGTPDRTSYRFCGEIAIDATIQGITDAHTEVPTHVVPAVQVK